jgi:hypothetical protein
MPARGRDRNRRRRLGLAGLLGDGGRYDRVGGQKGMPIAGLGNGAARGSLARPGVNRGRGWRCCMCLGRDGWGMVDVDAGVGGLRVQGMGFGYVDACEGGSVVGTKYLFRRRVVIKAVSSHRRILVGPLERMMIQRLCWWFR